MPSGGRSETSWLSGFMVCRIGLCGLYCLVRAISAFAAPLRRANVACGLFSSTVRFFCDHIISELGLLALSGVNYV